MCGLLTLVNEKVESEKVFLALQELKHRGPDELGSFSDERVTIGHTRLSVIDLQSGKQPIFNEDKTVVLVCNGEIYDHEKIRSHLETRGHRFFTNSDSEVILHLYEQHGLDLFQFLRGEFAFIIYDKRRNRLLAARDRFGIKPLFFSKTEKGFVFGSEAKALLATGRVRPQIDAEFVRNAFSMGLIGTAFENISALPPGSFMDIDLDTGEAEIQNYWSLSLPNYEFLESDVAPHDHAQKVRESVDEAVRLRLRSDVPVGVFLSGGIDSGIIISSMRKMTNKKIKAFTISFPESGEFDEVRLARKMAEHVGAELFELKLTKTLILENFEAMLWNTELPTHNMHGVGKFLLSKLAKEHVDVCLTGEGADEVFLGYDYFKRANNELGQSFKNVTGQVKELHFSRIMKRRAQRIQSYLGIPPLWEIVLSDSPFRKWFINSLFHDNHRKKLKGSSFLHKLRSSIEESETLDKGSLAQLQYYSLRFIMTPYILAMLGDRQEMAHSIEGRPPFLDHHLFEMAKGIPAHLKIQNGREKHILREAFKERLPKEIVDRPKWPYFAPIIPVRMGDHPTMDRLITTYLSREAIESAAIFNWRQINRIFRIYPFTFGKLRLKMDNLLTYMLSVQILSKRFCPENAAEKGVT